MSSSQTNSSDFDNEDTSEFFGGTAPAFSFENEGDICKGVIIAKELRLATQPDGTVDHWPDGRPKKLAVLTLMTTDGETNLYVRGYMQQDFITALKEQGLKDVQLGAYITVEWTETDPPTRKGLSGARHFEVVYMTAEDYKKGTRKLPRADQEPPF